MQIPSNRKFVNTSLLIKTVTSLLFWIFLQSHAHEWIHMKISYSQNVSYRTRDHCYVRIGQWRGTFPFSLRFYEIRSCRISRMPQIRNETIWNTGIVIINQLLVLSAFKHFEISEHFNWGNFLNFTPTQDFTKNPLELKKAIQNWSWILEKVMGLFSRLLRKALKQGFYFT